MISSKSSFIGVVVVIFLAFVQNLQVLAQNDEVEIFQENGVSGDDGTVFNGNFTPTVSASCRGGQMTIVVNTDAPFYGSIHPKDLRTAPCVTEGTGRSNTTLLSFNMLAISSDPDYCGVIINRNEERSVTIAVRAHKTLELATDKFYVITCGKAGFRNTRTNENYGIKMGFYNERDRLTNEVYYGRAYTLRVELTSPTSSRSSRTSRDKKMGDYSLKIRNCFSFGGSNSSSANLSSSTSNVPLIDMIGCPEKGVISRFSYSPSNQIAEATIYSMFRFQDTRRINFQCDVTICNDKEGDKCSDEGQDTSCSSPSITSRSAQQSEFPLPGKTSVLASSTVTVLDPGEQINPSYYEDGEGTCTGICPRWILWLCIVLGILFLLMLLVNLFLCSALTCTCTRTELIEKEPSVLEDYDPYRTTSNWTTTGSNLGGQNGGGQPYYSDHNLNANNSGSRYSLNNSMKGDRERGGSAVPKHYSMESGRDGSMLDHYARPTSRNSRYAQHQS